MYNIPRVSADRTEQLTDYEYEYEWLLDQAYKQMLADAANNQKVNIDDGKIERTFSMDQDEYEHILEMSQNGEFIDFEIPKNAPSGKKLSDNLLGTNKEQPDLKDKHIPVNLDDIFGGGSSGR